MNLTRTKRFKRDYKALTPNLQKQTDKQLQHLSRDLSHASLRVKGVQKHEGIFQARVNIDHRFLFEISSEGYTLLRVGDHKTTDRL